MSPATQNRAAQNRAAQNRVFPLPFTAPAQRRHRLCPLVMVGDPDMGATRALLDLCVSLGIDLVELCLPFPNAFTDGETLRRAHGRGLASGAGLPEALRLIADYAGRIDMILLADSSHHLRPLGMAELCSAAAEAGAAGILPHGLPPRMADDFHRAAQAAGLPVVGTLYAGSAPDQRKAAVARSSAFLYLVSAYGRSGGGAQPQLPRPEQGPAPEIAALQQITDLPVALGFGLKTRADVAAAFGAGARIAIVGSALSAAVEAGLGQPDPLAPARALLTDLVAALPAEEPIA